ncbi:MAG: hypothetical protein L0H74_07080, partial [Brachybacterium sp.]|nr:hypothetical protein [Brachybacterium sp.]
MDTTHTLYPLFSSDQVLSARHLNDLREHLDEQGRLTRANLIGVGIVCGLQPARPAPGTVTLSRGCGITSQGHLIVVDEDLVLAHVRRYVLPDDLDYPALRHPAPDRTPYTLWELVPDDDVPGAGPLSEAKLNLDEMALLLLRELRTGTGCGCGPGSCSHTGTDVTATVRPLLLDLKDLDEILETAATFEPTGDLGAQPAALLDLPDLRLPRVDVPATPLVESEDVLGAFQRAFGRTGLAEATADALSSLYAALRPLLDEDHPTDPFTGFRDRFGFLDTGAGTARQLLFLPGYWDLFDDLLRQYEEIRTAADGLLARCCPPGATFPRHLMVGALSTMPSAAGSMRARTTHAGVDAARYRHRFAPSPAVVGCRDRAGTVRDLFSRLVETIRCFTDQPSGEQVRLTPSRWGETPLADRAIPYYYELTGTPALHELWNPRLTARHRAHHNLGYRAEEFRPAPPPFVTEPLDYDLEPHDVLRVEGHLGSDVDDVLETLLEQRQEHRLPFDVVALRTGELDPRMAVDLSGHGAVFQDLEMHYDTLRTQQICALVELVQRVYELPWQRAVDPTPKAPQLWLLAHHAPEYLVRPGTVGWLLESRIAEGTSVFAADIESWQRQLIVLLNRFSDYARTLTEDLHDLDPDAVAQEHSQLQEFTEQIAQHFRTGEVMEGLRDLAAQLERVGRSCRLASVLEVHDEYLDRLAEVRRMQYLEAYLEQHPGIRHRSGVPLGGTLVLVYHEPPAVEPKRRVADAFAEWTEVNPDAWTGLVEAVGVDALRDPELRVHGDLRVRDDMRAYDDLRVY